ncbi:MAG: hypothetical protein L6Q54_01890 [Leptospiraceae bacterium]|nr:hypothetical protein [Leptospiraceae bacterium]MCK6379990.1 hypothetical protein [Leptospiraceae bacterium]NUM40167.1 hypothetical protein [Leptospiraceae bacterium]
MKNEKCFYVSFNVGHVEVWGSNLYSNKEAALLETENSKDKIVEQISAFSFKYLDDDETFEMLERAILDLKQYGTFRERENKLDFFILEQPILEHYELK